MVAPSPHTTARGRGLVARCPPNGPQLGTAFKKQDQNTIWLFIFSSTATAQDGCRAVVGPWPSQPCTAEHGKFPPQRSHGAVRVLPGCSFPGDVPRDVCQAETHFPPRFSAAPANAFGVLTGTKLRRVVYLRAFAGSYSAECPLRAGNSIFKNISNFIKSNSNKRTSKKSERIQAVKSRFPKYIPTLRELMCYSVSRRLLSEHSGDLSVSHVMSSVYVQYYM